MTRRHAFTLGASSVLSFCLGFALAYSVCHHEPLCAERTDAQHKGIIGPIDTPRCVYIKQYMRPMYARCFPYLTEKEKLMFEREMS